MINLDYLRPRKNKAVEKWYHAPYVADYHPRAEKYEDATILPLKRFPQDRLQFGRGGVVDEKGNYIDISGITDRIGMAYDIDEPVYKDEKVVYCGYLIKQWGHYLVEGVTRLWYFLKNDETVDKYVFFIQYGEEREIRGNYRQFLELLGVWDKIEIINKPTRYREVIVPERSFVIWKYWSQEYIDTFEKIAENAKPSADLQYSDKLFLSRSKIPQFDKKEFNMDMLDEFFGKNGYQVVYPEHFSLSDLVCLMRHAKTIASLSGSVQHNMMFAPKGIEHIIIEKTIVTVDFQIPINLMKEFDATYIDANLPIYPVSIGYGPYIMRYSGWLQKFAEDNGYLAADPSFEDPKRMKKILSKYMKAYEKEYQYQWFLMDWEQQFIASIREGYEEGFEYFKPYLTRKKPFCIRQYFEFHYWKQFAKRILRRA